MSQQIALFPILAFIAGVLGLSVTNMGLLGGDQTARVAQIEGFWGEARAALEAGEDEIVLHPADADAVCMIPAGADPIARLFSALGGAPDFPDSRTAAVLTARSLRADTMLAIRNGVVSSYYERPEWETAVALGGATCAQGGPARVIVHHSLAPFSGSEKTVHLILSP